MQTSNEPIIRTNFQKTSYQDILYSNCEKLLHKAAYRASKNSGQPFEEMRAHADLLFMQALHTFDDSYDNKFSTFLHTVVHNGLIDYGKSLSCSFQHVSSVVIDDKEVDILDTIKDDRSEKAFSLSEFLASLDEDQRIIVNLLLDGFATDTQSIQRILRQRFYFSQEKIDGCFTQLKEAMKTF